MTTAWYEVGDELRDIVTGFQGIVLGITYYATGCIHYGLQPKMSENSDELPN